MYIPPSPDYYYCVQPRSLFFFHYLPSSEPHADGLVGLRMLLENFGLSCCLHVFCRVEFLTLGVFLRNRQPADPQADRPAGEGAAIPSVEVSKWRPTSCGVLANFFCSGATWHCSAALDLILCFRSFPVAFFKFVLGLLRATLWPRVLVFIHADPVLATTS